MERDKLEFQGLGWKVRIRKRNFSYFFTLAKEIIIGNALKQSDEVFYYLVKHEERTAIILYLDGKERGHEKGHYGFKCISTST